MIYSYNFISRKMIFIWLLLVSSTVLSGELAQKNGSAQREKAAQQVAQQFVQQLGGQLKKEMKANGPVSAIKVCKEIAPGIANQLSLENGWRVTRVTTKPRNVLLGTADSWERESLAAFESRAAKGEQYASMSKA